MRAPLGTRRALIGTAFVSTALWAALAAAQQSRPSPTEAVRRPSQLEHLCRYSRPTLELVSSDGSAELEQARRTYHEERQRLLKVVREFRIPLERLGVVHYDRVMGVLTVSGVRDLDLFGGAYRLRLRQGCALQFELGDEQARDVMAQNAVGGLRLDLAVVAAARGDYERAVCLTPESLGQGTEGGLRATVETDLAWANVVDASGNVLASYQTQIGLQMHIRAVSQAVGASDDRVARVELSALSGTNGESGGLGGAWSTLGALYTPLDPQQDWVRRARAELELQVLPCYHKGLSANGTLQGALVVEWPVGRQEAQLSSVSNASLGAQGAQGRVLLDSLHSDSTTACVVDRLGRLPGELWELAGFSHLKATILLRLD